MVYLYGILNNYQVGSEAYTCMQEHIAGKKRVDKYHTLVIWDKTNMTERNIQGLRFYVRGLRESEDMELEELENLIDSKYNKN